MLVRRRNSVSHGHLSYRARERNVRCVFKDRARRKVSLQGKTVILIDDVLTMGATVEACTRTLWVAGTVKFIC